MTVRRIVNQKCEYEGCQKKATTLVVDRYGSREGTDTVLCCCDEHARVVVEKDVPEYLHTCPNCGCWMGV